MEFDTHPSIIHIHDSSTPECTCLSVCLPARVCFSEVSKIWYST